MGIAGIPLQNVQSLGNRWDFESSDLPNLGRCATGNKLKLPEQKRVGLRIEAHHCLQFLHYLLHLLLLAYLLGGEAKANEWGDLAGSGPISWLLHISRYVSRTDDPLFPDSCTCRSSLRSAPRLEKRADSL